MTRYADVKGPIPGPRSLAVIERERAYLAPGIQSISTLAGIAVERGEGARITDVDGNTYLDLVAGICVSSLGHGHPALAEALAAQASRMTATSFACAERAELLERIAGQASQIGGKAGSGKLRRTQLYSGGAEAVESALRLARAYTKRYEVLSFWGGFHGKTGGVAGLMGSEWKRGLGPSTHVPGLHLAPYPDAFRSPLDGGASVANDEALGKRYLGFLREKLRLETDGALAAIIVEPIQGTAGNVIPPPGFLRGLRELCNELGALLVCDEMITGWARTGAMFGQMHEGVEADIVTFGKGVGNGFPVTGLITTDEIADPKKNDPWGRPSFSSSSYGGSPLAAAAANAVTRVIVEQQLDLHAKKMGERLLAGLQMLARKHAVIGEVRGRGLLLAVELIDPTSSSRAPLAKPQCERLFKLCLERGLLTMAYAPRVRINPPLVIDEAEIDEALAIFDQALSAL